MKQYDYLIVGAGFFGAVFARMMHESGYKILVIDRRNHIAGNAFTRCVDDIDVHVYGPHIFHTNNKEIWDFVNIYSDFEPFINSPKINDRGMLYSLPFNMNTFYELWRVTTPEQAQNIIGRQRLKLDRAPENLEEQALMLVGTDIYEKFIKGYTEKQWHRSARELPPDIIKRIPLRWTFNNNYFNDRYQGIPSLGYTKLFENLLHGIETQTGIDYLKDRGYWNDLAEHVVFTGPLDEFFDYEHGRLEYRSLRFETKILEIENYQGNAVINYPSPDIPWTRIIEHKHFKNCQSKRTVITREIPLDADPSNEPYYPVNDDTNQSMYEKYQNKSELMKNMIFGGRLAEYRYYDMHQVIGSAMKKAREELSKRNQ